MVPSSTLNSGGKNDGQEYITILATFTAPSGCRGERVWLAGALADLLSAEGTDPVQTKAEDYPVFLAESDVE